MMAAELVIEAVRRQTDLAGSRAIVVAVDGHSGAGKSTLAAVVAERAGAAVVHVDDFYRDMAERDRRDLTAAQGADRYFDWERLKAEAIVPLAQRMRAVYGCFDWAVGHGLTKPVTIDPRDVVLVEGVYSARPEFDGLLDVKVLVDLPAGTRAQRRQQRARTVSRYDPQGWDARWDAAERHYFHAIRPREAFDLIVPGDS
jgi:uridine kinase